MPTPATYYLTRDTNCQGELSTVVDVWYRKPMRCKITIDNGGYTWLPSVAPGEDRHEVPRDLGYYGNFTLAQCVLWFRTIPETDIECIKVETQLPDPKKEKRQ